MITDIQYTRTADGCFIPITPSSTQTGLHERTHQTLPPAPKWDGWPDGNFSQDFTHEEVKATGNLCWHWPFKSNGGYRNGDTNAAAWQNGKKSSKKCLGVIQCENPDCEVILRVATTPQRLAKQLVKVCECSSSFFHQNCDVVGYTWTWNGGQHYENCGHHCHS